MLNGDRCCFCRCYCPSLLHLQTVGHLFEAAKRKNQYPVMTPRYTRFTSPRSHWPLTATAPNKMEGVRPKQIMMIYFKWKTLNRENQVWHLLWSLLGLLKVISIHHILQLLVRNDKNSSTIESFSVKLKTKDEIQCHFTW